MRDPEPLRALLHRALARYLTVTPRGFVVARGADPEPRIVVRILGYGGARTLYRQRRPLCRSLDGSVSVTNPDKHCDRCELVDSCTPQVRVDLVVDGKPHRLMLAFTSATNFLAYVGQLRDRRVAIDAAQHEMIVVARGSWGEVRFREAR